MDAESPVSPHAETTVESVLPVPSSSDASGDQADGATSVAGRHWRVELARWLLTLNPGRTQDEYSKAVRYFFETPGVPQDLEAIAPDLLLAYRGALAMRAQRGRNSRPLRNKTDPDIARLGRLWGASARPGALPGDAPSSATDTPPSASRPTTLAPATVNLRLTALRQFLRYVTIREPLPNLSVERIHLALKRLPIERRRPYQILSEDEWAAFLETARQPMTSHAPANPSASASTASAASSPWGHTRAERLRSQAELANASTETPGPVEPQLRASDGRTGALTAQRDFALVALALTTGLRAIELSLLDVGDLTHERRRGQDEWWLTLPDEKTKGQRGGRALPLAPDLMTALIEYLRATGRSLISPRDRETPLFLALPRGPRARPDGAARPRRLRPEQIRGVINRIETQWVARINAESRSSDQMGETRRISPHALRHSAAIALLKGSEETGRPPASVEHVRGWLGHFDIRTTQRYLDHLNSREERRRFAITPQVPLSPQPPRRVQSDATDATDIADIAESEP